MILHPELPVASFISAALVLVPLPWHWRAGTVATISISLWLFVINMINGINSMIWAHNVDIIVPVWCDISTKILIGANIAVPSSLFCLCVHLERVSSIRRAQSSFSDKRRRQIFDGLICFGVPLIYMILHYVVQGHRFDIVEDFGCRPTTYVSVASIFIIWIPPLIFCVGACILSAMAFRHFWIRRITFARHLQDSNTALTPSRYFRLMSMALVQMFWGIAVTVFNMWFTTRHGLRPWTGWADVHVGFSRIALFPTLLIPVKELTYTYVAWWTIPISSVLFFGFFSFGQDAMAEYRSCVQWVKRVIFRQSVDPSSRKASPPFTFRLRGTKPSVLPTNVKIDVSITRSGAGSLDKSHPFSLNNHRISSVQFPDPAPAYYAESSPFDSSDSLNDSPSGASHSGFRPL